MKEGKLTQFLDNLKPGKVPKKPDVLPPPQQPPPPPPPPPQQIFRRVGVGYGGTFIFNESSIPHIGTDRCQSGVGVYFVVDDKRCFAAHISCAVENTTGTTKILDQTTYQKLQGRVTQLLAKEAARSQWPPVSTYMQGSFVAVCYQHPLHSQGVSWDTVLGDWVADAVAGWLGIPPGDARRTPLRRGGFIVHHPSQVQHFFPGDVDRSAWTAVTDQPQTAHWQVGARQ